MSASAAAAAPAPAPTPLLSLRVRRRIGAGQVAWRFLDHRCDRRGLGRRRYRECRGGRGVCGRRRRFLGWPWPAVAPAIVAPFRFVAALAIGLSRLLLCVALSRPLRFDCAPIFSVATLAIIAPPVAARRVGLLIALAVTLPVALAVSTAIALFLVATAAVTARLASIVTRRTVL